MPSSTINKPQNLPFVVSIGEPSGIGPEIILKSWNERQKNALPPFFVMGNHSVLNKTARKIGLNIPVDVILSPAQAVEIFPHSLPVIDINPNGYFEFNKPTVKTAPLVIQAIKKSVDLIFDDEVAGLITAPIQKSILYEAGFTCPGHTEFLAELCHDKTSNMDSPIMMLVAKDLRVVPLTIHMAIRDVADYISQEIIKKACIKIHTALQQDFGIASPRIAVSGLNPHAGEDGGMGHEENEIIQPALDYLRGKGMDIKGPLPADTMFHAQARTQYDAALCMYHDQALIPVKTIDFDGGVNITLGLPIIRTSPDHGTALNIAGQNMASPTSMINAIKQAEKIHDNRISHHV